MLTSNERKAPTTAERKAPTTATLLMVLTATLVATACQTASESPPVGGSDAMPPPNNLDGGAGETSDATVDADPIATACPEAPTARRTQGAILELPIVPELAGKALRFGEANTAANGDTVTPLNFRFYVSAVTLISADGSPPIAVDLVKADGTPKPYGVHFFNADDPSSTVLRVRAPAGTYSEVTFAFGLDDACNAGAPVRNEPLSESSQMTWPHGGGYLFLRYESNVTAAAPADAGAGPDARADAGADARSDAVTDAPAGTDATVAPTQTPTAIHMGGFPRLLMAPVIHAKSALTVPATGTVSHTLRLLMDQVFKGAQTSVPSEAPIPPPGVEAALGENLRQAAKTLTLFVLSP